MRASESPNYSDLLLRRERNRWFADSPLEGSGFELPVPRCALIANSALAALSAAETEAWRRAVARAECGGTYFVAQPFYCAVGTKPP